ncbi:ATP-binding protein [Sphingomonas immobilis]|uniref:histidine kinase n=1 Tax=Sphingomonas immobilis TaxID=3063997 RepID=A0ABT8ZYZ7_9SPHN|nr:ATP-binding protein [Sphingomonas sp. CA1-15]MDO7842508.1 ATP-binding protein [Sphingomonas sp. CA1-15]
MKSQPVLSPEGANFLTGDGEMTRLIRTKDWSQTPLGGIEDWPQSLRTTVSLCLASNFPINIIWGPSSVQIYNDGYRVVCGDAHPIALGQDYRVTWESAWPAIGLPYERAKAGETSFLENERMFLTRNGYLEETFFTFSLSPIRDELGEIGGLFHPVTETTATMLAERRTRALRDLTASLTDVADLQEMADVATATLSRFEYDLPFVLFYTLDEDAGIYRLASNCGVARGTDISPVEFDPVLLGPWRGDGPADAPRLIARDGFAPRLADDPCGPYEEAPDRGFMLFVSVPGVDMPPAVVVLGVSARLPLDDTYRGFYELIAAALSAALATIRARQDERRRAAALAEIDRAKTVFFSNVSHEFRTPLTLMLGPLEDALAEDALPPRQAERLDLAHRNAQRLLRLVNALLDFARIEAGRIEARFEPIDLGAFTANLASNFRSACERAGLALHIDAPSMSAPTFVDRDMWEKIVLNLLSNAFKFTLAGEIAVTVRDTGDGIELAVRDSGVGINPAELPRVFERFHRVEGQNGRTHEGTGIGLSMVQELVGLHGGAIAAESEEGVGTTFRVWLPAGSVHVPQDAIVRAEVAAPEAKQARAFVEEALRWLPDQGATPDHTVIPTVSPLALAGDASRIVLADDNADMRDYVRQILQEGGYEVDAFTNGADALQAARHGRIPDLILTDVMMPVMNGFELLSELRADPELEDLVVILLSARAGAEARVEGLAAGADDYLVKPFSARELRARVDGAVRLGRQRRESARRETMLRDAVARADLQRAEQQRDHAVELSKKLDARVAERTLRLHESNERLKLLEEITRAIGQRQDVDSIFEIVVRKLEERLPADFVSIFRYDSVAQSLTVARVGSRSATLAGELGLTAGTPVNIDQDGLAHSVAGALVYEPDTADVQFAFPARLAARGLRSLVVAPLSFERAVFGVLVVARHKAHDFVSADSEFLRQLGEHAALAADQAELHDSLQRAVDHLRQSQQSAVEQERLRAIGQMASGIAHDINNAISPVAIYTQSLLERNLDLSSELRGYLQIVGRVVEDIAATVARLRDFYRPEDAAADPEPVDLNELVPQVVELTRARWSDMPQQRGLMIKVATSLETDLPHVMGSAAAFREALTNLIFNAVDAMGEGGTITVRTASLSAGPSRGARVLLEVGDTGPGMDEETRARCLEPFFTTKGERGTGLGLAMVQATAQRHGAVLDIDSALGEGTRVRLEFVAAPVVRTTKSPTLSADAERPLRLLIVDDDRAVLTSTAFVLELSGHAITPAEGGQAGLDALQAAHSAGERFDAVVTDLGMPYVDGNQVATRVKALFPDTAVILLTGWGQRMSAEPDGKTIFDYQLSKPVDLDELRGVLADI